MTTLPLYPINSHVEMQAMSAPVPDTAIGHEDAQRTVRRYQAALMKAILDHLSGKEAPQPMGADSSILFPVDEHIERLVKRYAQAEMRWRDLDRARRVLLERC